MLTASEVLKALEKSGCQVTLDGDQLKVRGPLTDDLRQAIREHKPGLIAELRRRDQAATDRQTFVQDVCKQLNERGVARFHSERLNETIFVISDWGSHLLTLPENALVFSLQELQNMATQSYSTEELKALATAKRELLAAQRQWLAERREMVPDAVAMALRAFPGAAVVDMDQSPAAQEPDRGCYICKSSDFWAQPGGGQACGMCHPQPRT
jgi:hypothetical protein